MSLSTKEYTKLNVIEYWNVIDKKNDAQKTNQITSGEPKHPRRAQPIGSLYQKTYFGEQTMRTVHENFSYPHKMLLLSFNVIELLDPI